MLYRFFPTSKHLSFLILSFFLFYFLFFSLLFFLKGLHVCLDPLALLAEKIRAIQAQTQTRTRTLCRAPSPLSPRRTAHEQPIHSKPRHWDITPSLGCVFASSTVSCSADGSFPRWTRQRRGSATMAAPARTAPPQLRSAVRPHLFLGRRTCASGFCRSSAACAFGECRSAPEPIY
jgi:hypothetical protein